MRAEPILLEEWWTLLVFLEHLAPEAGAHTIYMMNATAGFGAAELTCMGPWQTHVYCCLSKGRTRSSEVRAELGTQALRPTSSAVCIAAAAAAAAPVSYTHHLAWHAFAAGMWLTSL